MALNIKNAEVERLAIEVSRMAKESKTEAIRRALEDRKMRLAVRGGNAYDRVALIKEYLEREVRPLIPANLRGKRISKREREEILGIGPKGYPE
jgi:antitoxin VapB